MNKRNFLAIAIITALFSCKQSETKVDFLAANIDSTVKPSTDFFQFANGGWIKRNPIPDDESDWGIGQLVNEEIYTRLKTINEKAVAEKGTQDSITQKTADFWTSGMDTIDIEKQGLKPLQPLFDSIKAIKTPIDLIRIVADLHNKSINCLFTDGVGQDDKNSEKMVYQIWQGGLGMPNREYYFNTDIKSVTVKNAYNKYLFQTFKRLGEDSVAATKSASVVFNIELQLAKASRKLVNLRDPYKNYNKLTFNSLQGLTPSIDWALFTKKEGIEKLEEAIVGQPEFLQTVNNAIKSTPIDSWKKYLQAHVVYSLAAYLDNATFQEKFDYTKTLTGASKPRPRWKRILDAEEEAIGEALGQLFVKEYFNEKAKQRYNDLVEAIRAEYKTHILQLTWMSDSTKQKAIEKLGKITKKVGYPDKWKDFSAMNIDKVPFVINVLRANEWWSNYNVQKLGKPVDRTEWNMTPQTYNAYYNASNNEIILPAGIFTVPGVRDEDLDDAFVYGYAAASTIGHEITHGFDDQGRQYDANGNLKNWWQPNDSLQFANRAKKIINQFNAFVPVDTLHINGTATQGENIADLGGLRIALDAFKKSDAFKSNKSIGGYTPLQRYFLGYAYGWMYTQRKERIANLVMTDVHAPAKERVNGPFVNLPEFYEAFHIQPTDKMYLPDSLRVNIW